MKTQLAHLAIFTAFFAGTATASNVTIPNTFSSGTPAVAAEVNDNFSAVKTAVDDNQTQIDAVKTTADANTLQIGINTTNVGINSSDISALSTRVDGAAIAVPGNNPGDMQYWDGSAWVLIAAPAPGTAKAKLGFCNDKPSWDCIAVGDTGPAGGIVFYVAADGISGLEAAPADLAGTYSWGCDGTDIGTVGPGLSDVGSGAINTAEIILAACGGNAAIAADAYSLGVFTDWFLPSKDELNLLFAQKAVVNATGLLYWSSTENGASASWYQDFNDASPGVQDFTSKTTTYSVRPVRAF